MRAREQQRIPKTDRRGMATLRHGGNQHSKVIACNGICPLSEKTYKEKSLSKGLVKTT
ncbi:MAG: hypothetical protein OEZ48_03160 [Candidatus Bathyarchaeota archaeon]|nr:hypothetical protein [Candidatus Bathyarchaeota archaeon]MDH5686847.1 hypothetical protein [Candidatus Bathyarchaeota archaeon]